MSELSGVFLQVDAANADPSLSIRGLQHQMTLGGERMFILGDLVAFGKVGIEIVLAGEDAHRGDLAPQSKGNPQSIFNCPLINHRQDTRHSRANWANRNIWF